MKVTGEFVLVEQTDTKKDSKIILTGNKEKEGYVSSFKIKQIGPTVPVEWGLEVEKTPVFSQNVTFLALKVTTPPNQANFKTALVVVHYADIISLD
jgi:hypothetical protein